MDYVKEMTGWFERHHTARKFAKAMIMFGVAFLVDNQVAITAHLPPFSAVVVISVIVAIDNYVKHNTTFPIVGAKVQEVKANVKKKK